MSERAPPRVSARSLAFSGVRGGPGFLAAARTLLVRGTSKIAGQLTDDAPALLG